MTNQRVEYNLKYAAGLASAFSLLGRLMKRPLPDSGSFPFSEMSGFPLPDELLHYIQGNQDFLNRSFHSAGKFALGPGSETAGNSPLQLNSLLSRVSGGKGEAWYPVSPFDPGEPDTFFPKDSAPQKNPDWSSLVNSFQLEATKIQSQSLPNWILLMDSLLVRYTTLLPWPLGNFRDIPLLESIRMIAALMASDYEKGKPMLMVGCDLSGIQNYLFDIQSKNAAKLLKGRSFYLHLLTDAILRRILNDNNLQHGHVIYATAGGFYMIIPDSVEIQENLSQFRKDLLLSNYKCHGEKLYTALSWIQTDGSKFETGETDIEFRKLSESLNAEKRKPYHGVMKEILRLGHKETEEDDLMDDEGWVLSEKEPEQTGAGGRGSKYSGLSLYQQQQLLGRQLLDSEGVAVWYNSPNADGIEPGGLGVRYKPFTRKQFPDSADSLVVFNKIYTNPEIVPVKTDWYGGNIYPRHRNNRPMTYDELSGSEGDSLKRLGVLRMDVDNLGSVFISGLPEGQRSIVRYAFLSRSLDQFFKLYLNFLHNRRDREYKDWTQILYAGGDDLFILGKWDFMIQFAEEIRTEFKRYCGNNPVLSVSAGISLVTGKFPVIRAAQWAGEQEENAKGYQYEGFRKDAIGIFDYSLQWSQEWRTVLEMKEMLRQYLTLSGHRSMIQRISQYHRIAGRGSINEGKEGSLRWRWQMAYDFSRIGKSSDPELVEILKRIRNAVVANDWNHNRIPGKEDGLTLLAIAARLLEFETRTTN